MWEFLKGFFTESDASTLVARIVFVVAATLVFFLFFYFAKKRNLQLFTYITVGAMVLLFAVSFLVNTTEALYVLAFAFYFLMFAFLLTGLMLFTQDLNRSIFRLSIKRKLFKDGLPDHFGSEELSKSVNEIIKACLRLSKTDTGALIVIADHLSDDILDSGIQINADITAELLETLFFPKTPLHDGAVIITANRVVAAGCYLPLTQATNLPREFGTRHRAAIGVAAAFPDLTAIVVSEETGIISAMHDNKIKRYLDTKQLQNILECAMGLADESAEDRLWGDERK